MSKNASGKDLNERPFFRFVFTDKYGKTFEVVGQIKSETQSEIIIDTADDEERKYLRTEYPTMTKTQLPSDGPLPVFFNPE